MGLFDAAEAFLRSEFDSVRRYDIPWRRRLWLYWNGFLSSKDVVWDLTEDTVDHFLSDVEYRDVKRIAQPYGAGLKNRVLFHLVVARAFPDLLPDVYALVRNGEFVDARRFGELGSFTELLEVLNDDRVVVKPVTAAKGDGVRILDGRDGTLRQNGRPIERSALEDSFDVDRDLIFVEHVDQATYAEDIYPGSTNTLRVLTMIDPETDEPFIARATHRFGTATSDHVDNWSAGGISASVDREAGELGAAVVPPRGGAEGVTWVETHPETEARIAGVSIPSWDSIKHDVLELAAEFGWLWPQVGWDVVVRDDHGTVTVLEGEPQSVDADQQAHGPLLADERARRFYEHHGVIRDNGGSPLG